MEVVTSIPCQTTSRGRPQFKDTIFIDIRFRWVELGQNLFPDRRFHFPVAFPKELWQSSVGNQMEARMKRTDVQQGTLALMVLKTLQVLGPLHGYGIARRIEQISGDLLSVNQGTLYPVLLRLEQEGAVASDWGTSDNNRKARFYRLTPEGAQQLDTETQDWELTSQIMARFLNATAESL
jgi:transcriptional regulator